MPRKPFILNVDQNVANQDWLKSQTWDGPTDVRSFLRTLSLNPDTATKAQKRAAVRHFMLLPAARRLPAGIKTALVKQGIL